MAHWLKVESAGFLVWPFIATPLPRLFAQELVENDYATSCAVLTDLKTRLSTSNDDSTVLYCTYNTYIIGVNVNTIEIYVLYHDIMLYYLTSISISLYKFT